MFRQQLLSSSIIFYPMNILTLIPLFLGNLRGSEILIIALIILLLFGGKKIPELMRGIGKGVKSFRQGMNEINNEVNRDNDSSGKTDSANEN